MTRRNLLIFPFHFFQRRMTKKIAIVLGFSFLQSWKWKCLTIPQWWSYVWLDEVGKNYSSFTFTFLQWRTAKEIPLVVDFTCFRGKNF